MADFQWYRAYDKLNVSVYIVDAETYEILYFNERVKSKLSDSAIGGICYKAFCDSDKPCDYCLPVTSLNDVEDNTFTETKKRYNPVLDVYLDIYERIVEWDDGRKARLLIAIDVTEREKGMLKIEKFKSKSSIHEAIISSADMLFFALNADKEILYVNERYQEITGINLNTGDKLPVDELYSEYDAVNFHKNIFPKVINGKTIDGEVVLFDTDKNEMTVRYSSFPIKDEDGNIFAYGSIGEDVTEKRKMKSTTEWQHLILQNTQDLSACSDLDYNLVYTNPAMSKITGWKVGDNARGNFFTDESYDKIFNLVCPNVKNGMSWNGQVDFIDRNGNSIPTDAKFFPIYDENGIVSGIATTATDISSQIALINSTQKQLKMQEFLSTFSAPFMQPYDFDELIVNALRELKDFLNVDRASIFEFKDKHFLVCTYENLRDESIPSIVGAVKDYDIIKEAVDIIDTTPCYYIKDTAEFYTKYPHMNMDSQTICYVPIMAEGNRTGYLILSTLEEKNDLDDDSFKLCAIAASIIAGAYAMRDSANAILKSKERLEIAMEISHAAIWEIDYEKNLFIFDDTFAFLFKLPFKSPVPIKKFTDYYFKVISEKDASNIMTLIKKPFTKNTFTTFSELRNELPDGTTIYTRNSGRQYFNSNGSVSHILGMVWEITDTVIARQKQIKAQEQELRVQEFMTTFSAPFLKPYNFDELIIKSLNELMKFFHCDRASICILDKDNYYTCRFSTCEKFSNKANPVKFHADSISKIIKIIEVSPYYYISDTSLVTDKTPDFAYGSKSICYIPLNFEGTIIGYLAFVTLNELAAWTEDIFKLAVMASSVISGAFVTNAARKDLEKTEERLKLAISSSNMGVWEISIPEKSIYFDEGTAKLFNITKPSPLTMPQWADHLSQFIDNELYADYLYYLRYEYDGTEFHKFDTLKAVYPDGTVKYTKFSEKAILAPDGKPERLIGITWEVTKDVLLVEQLERTTQQAAEANRAKSDFLSRMSHEIRTPLNAIVGMTNIAKNSTDLLKRNNCLEAVQNASNQLMGIINDVLDISKIESGKVELINAPFIFESSIEKAFSLISDKVNEKNLNLNYIHGDNLKWWYIGDEMRVSQIIINLLSNAVKFTPEHGEITVSVDELMCAKCDKPYIQLRVKDTGIGMNSEQLNLVFKPFEQADGTITRRFGGTGLGLTICKNLIEKMDGTIEVKSELGAGSEFIVSLPLVHAYELEKSRLQEVIDKSKNFKILVGTRNKELEDLFCKLADDLSWIVDVADADKKLGADYVVKASDENKPYDAIFVDTDIVTPLVRERMYSFRHLTPPDSTVYITKIGEWSSIQQVALDYGISRFLQKPLTVISIIHMVLSIIDKCTDINTENDVFDFSDVNILLTEDIEINRMIFNSLLEDTNICIDEAENGNEAVEMFKNNYQKYDMIFMDIQMPYLNGLDATKKIRELDIPNAKEIPIIALTASAFKEDIEACVAAGMNDHIAKPFEPNVVMEKIKLYAVKQKNLLT